MHLGLAIVGLVSVLGTGCAASISRAEHRKALTEAQTRYEGWLAGHRREVERAQLEAARCAAEAQARTEIERTRVVRLQRSLSAKDAQLRQVGASQRSSRVGPRLAEIAKRMPVSAGIQQSGDQLTVILPGSELFAAGSATLHAEGRAVLGELAEAIAGSGASMTVAAHVDRLFAARMAWKLSADRARSVIMELQGLGLDPARMILRAHAGYVPGTGGIMERIELVFEDGD